MITILITNHNNYDNKNDNECNFVISIIIIKKNKLNKCYKNMECFLEVSVSLQNTYSRKHYIFESGPSIKFGFPFIIYVVVICHQTIIILNGQTKHSFFT